MIGTHADIAIADAWWKGIRNFDLNVSYQAVYQAATTQQVHASRNDVADWIAHGFIPDDKDGHAVCDSLSYAIDDWAVGNIATAMGLHDDAAIFYNRSQNYRNVWNAKEQIFCPKNITGVWNCPDIWVDPILDNRYVEGDAWQWRWYVQHDPAGLISLFSSKDYFISQLTEFFERSKDYPTNDVPDPYYWAGNEPDIFAAYLFAFTGRPDLTQQYVRWNMDNKYTSSPDGIPGNDDYGAMSAWFLLGALGIYPQPGSMEGLYILGSPLFGNVTLHLPSSIGGDLEIVAYNNSATNIYATKYAINGVALTEPFVTHQQLLYPGSNLFEFWMASSP